MVDSAATLIGVALLIVTAVHVTGQSAYTWADNLSFGAALLFLCSCAASHQGIARSSERLERIADGFFAAGLLLLFLSSMSFWL
jgi:hypothetical protein